MRRLHWRWSLWDEAVRRGGTPTSIEVRESRTHRKRGIRADAVSRPGTGSRHVRSPTGARDSTDQKQRAPRADGLLKLVDTAVAHLFKELYFRETGEWLGEEVHRDVPKIEQRAAPDRAA